MNYSIEPFFKFEIDTIGFSTGGDSLLQFFRQLLRHPFLNQ